LALPQLHSGVPLPKIPKKVFLPHTATRNPENVRSYRLIKKGSTMTTFKSAAVTGLKTLVSLWKDGNTFRSSSDPTKPGPGGCFWMAGNLFHTAVDCMVKTQQKDDGFIPGTTLGQEALKFFIDATTTNPSVPPAQWGEENGPLGYWVDDYGWWGLALLRAYQNADFLGYTSFKEDLATNSKNCWTALNARWNNTAVTWVDSNNSQHTITGGIPNTWDDSITLAGRNSVTNECYWLLSSFLASTFSGDGNNYLDPNTNFNNFFAQGTNPNILFNSNRLVLERFFGMRSPNQRWSWPNTDHPNWTWLGDQGLFFGCCWNNPEFGPGNFGSDQATAIFNAVQSNNITANGVLHEDLAPYAQFQLDYACGKGTLMRYLTDTNDLDHRMGGSGRFDGFLKTNAIAVWKNQIAGCFPYYWDKEATEPTGWGYNQQIANAVLHAAGLCAINATLPWMENDSID
jgi:hypothetical protein